MAKKFCLLYFPFVPSQSSRGGGGGGGGGRAHSSQEKSLTSGPLVTAL